MLIANIGKEGEKNVEQRDKEEADNLTGVGAKPENALSITSLGFSFSRDATQPVEILTLINNKISETWQIVTTVNCYGYKQYAGALMPLPNLLYCYTLSSMFIQVLITLAVGLVLYTVEHWFSSICNSPVSYLSHIVQYRYNPQI